jgi:hypothetical protein
MSKVKLTFNYKDYVVDIADALTVIDILDRAERMDTKWDKDSGKSYFVYDEAPDDKIRNLELIPDDLYRMAKLAGKPTN